jgi:hypothetical protein
MPSSALYSFAIPLNRLRMAGYRLTWRLWADLTFVADVDAEDFSQPRYEGEIVVV